MFLLFFSYDISWRVLNARHWLAQYRERVYIVGVRKDIDSLPMNWEAVTPASSSSTVRSILETSPDELEAARLSTSQQTLMEDACQKQYNELIKKPDNDSPWLLKAIDIDGKSPTLISGYHTASNFSTKFIFENVQDNPSSTDTDSSVVMRHRARFLTPRECARLMGFPDEFPIVNGDTDQGRGLFYRQIGNAVCPPLIESVARQLLISLQTPNEL